MPKLKVVALFVLVFMLVCAVRAQEPVTLVYDQLVEGQVKADEPALWTFMGTGGDSVEISMTSAEFDTYLELLDPNDTLIASNDDDGVALNALLQATLPIDGVYTIIARSYSNQQAGHFHLSLALLATDGLPQVSEIQADQTIDAVLSPGVSDRWAFTGSAGEFVRISMTSVEFDTYLELLDPTGQQIAYDDDSGDGFDALLEVELPTSGVYTILARSYSNSASGAYRLALASDGATDDALDGTDTPNLPLTVEGTLTSSEGDRWVFTGITDDTVRITLIAASFDAFLELYDPLDRLVVNNDDGAGGTDAQIETTLSMSGEFVIVARAHGSEIGSGAYRLIVEWLRGTPDTLLRSERAQRIIRYGETIESVLLPGARDLWTFEGVAGDVVTITMSSDDFDSLLELYDPTGAGLDDDDDSAGNSNARITSFQLRDSGTFTIVARAYLESMTGLYTLSLQPG